MNGSVMGRYRHELKYLISYKEKDILEERIRAFAGLDPHAANGQYFIRSLYFDDHRHSAYEEKNDGVAKRQKYRIRIYDFGDEYIRLECKQKSGGYILKRSAGLSGEEFGLILKGRFDFLLKREDDLLHEFYTQCVTGLLRPEVIVDYDRIPYIYDAGTVRITFDMHVRSAFGDYDIFNRSLPSYEVMPKEFLIMEVKYTEFLPDIFRSIITADALVRQAASKYVMCDDLKRKMYE